MKTVNREKVTIDKKEEATSSVFLEELFGSELYSRKVGLEIEIGFGRSRILPWLASRRPGTIFLGLEKNVSSADNAKAIFEKKSLPNLRFIHYEALKFLLSNKLLPMSVDVIHIYYPTPFPFSERIFTNDFNSVAKRILKSEGEIRIVTDNRRISDSIHKCFASFEWKVLSWIPKAVGQPKGYYVGTPWEKKTYCGLNRFGFVIQRCHSGSKKTTSENKFLLAENVSSINETVKGERMTSLNTHWQQKLDMILHEHAYSLETIRLLADAASRYFGKTPFQGDRVPTSAELAEVLDRPIQDVLKSIIAIKETIGETFEQRGISKNEIEFIDQLIHRIKEYLHEENFGRHHSTELVEEIYRFLRVASKPSFRLKKGLKRELLQRTKEIERLMGNYYLSSVQLRIMELREQTRTLRDFQTANQQDDKPRQIIDLLKVTKAATSEHEALATKKGLKFRFVKESTQAFVRANKDRIFRAISNIINNGIKYNCVIPNGGSIWLDIGVDTKGDTVEFWCESWGVPIEPDEIESKKIFEPCYRGKYSRQSDASGNGLGLTDAERTVRSHHGRIEVISKPTQFLLSGKPNYNRPFLTKVIIVLPKSNNAPRHEPIHRVKV